MGNTVFGDTSQGTDVGDGNDVVSEVADIAITSVPSDDNMYMHEIVGNCVKTHLRVTHEGTLDVDLNDEESDLSKLLKPVLEQNVEQDAAAASGQLQEDPGTFVRSLMSMNVVIFIVGSRGDVQPFISLGKVLKEKYSHRVRIATHLAFKTFVEQNDLEFFNIGGDPTELMAYMVRNPGLIPDLHTIKSGDIGKRRKSIYEILNGCWRACIEPGDGTKPKSHIGDSQYDLSDNEPFIADAIIANPPSFAHIHCAEKLGIPLHMMFTMPWSPTQSFPHPLVNIKSSNAGRDMTNYISYTLVDIMTWQGLGDVINKFRNKALNLGPVSVMWAPGMTHRLRIPFTYCWSPALIPKPADWGRHISISGFYFLSLASSYAENPALLKFLKEGPPPVYIGFGSIVVDDPDGMTQLIFKAIQLARVRALVSHGWGGLGAREDQKPDHIFMLGNVPHDWLFQHVSAVIHHGGAGTTAAGILAGKPTVVVPFFGDQPFWGSMIAHAGAGPEPIPYKHLTAEILAEQIRIALRPETVERARALSAEMSAETGADSGAKSFHESLGSRIQCSVIPGRAAVWRFKKTKILLSTKAVSILRKEGLIDMNELKLHRPKKYEIEDGPWDPVSGVASVLLGTLSSLVVGAADIPSGVFHSLKKNLQSKHGESDKTTSNSNSIISDVTLSTSTLISDLLPTTPSNQETESPKSSLVINSDLTEPPEETSLIDDDYIDSDASGISLASGVTAEAHEKEHQHLPQRLDHAKQVASRMAEIGLTVPMDIANSLAQGFHNAPRIYQDHTVRPQENITGMKSGLQAAVKDFAHGIYDGVTGVVMQPLRSATREGPVGLLKGVGKGIGGLVLKPSGALFSVPADALKGAYKELRKIGDVRLEEHVINSRMIQGDREAEDVSETEKAEIVERWVIVKTKAMRSNLRDTRSFRPKMCQKRGGHHAQANQSSDTESEESNDDNETVPTEQLHTPTPPDSAAFEIGHVETATNRIELTTIATTETET